jgi:hypothetical protein
MRRAWLLIAITATGCGAASKPGPPLSFAPNRGQFSRDVRFAAQGAGYELAATDRGLTLALKGERVQLAIPGAPRAGAALPGKANYILGEDWHTNVPTYAGVAYDDAWPGVDVSVYGSAGRFEYDLQLSPGADAGAIALRFDPPAQLTRDGSLKVGGLTQPPPVTRQGDRTIPSGYVINPDGTVGFKLGRYDRTRPLVIDPVLAYSTYLGGAAGDSALAVAVDSSGSAYVTGQTQSTDFPGTPGAKPGGDAFVTKLAPDGHTVAWTTFLGGSDFDEGRGIALTADGVIVGGSTASANFPTASPIQVSRNGFRDAFLTKLSLSGGIVWSTYYGGAGADDGNGVAADPAGNAYLAGTSDADAFVLKLNAAGTFGYATPLGGDQSESGNAIAVDAGGNAYVAGRAGDHFPTTVGPGYGGGNDAFAAKLGPTGAVTYATYLGGTTFDEAYGVAAGAGGTAVVTGTTQSGDFPAPLPLHGLSDAFVARLSATGALAEAQFLGGSGTENGDAVAIDGAGHVVVAGRTDSGDFPAGNTKGAGLDAFVTQLGGTSLFLGGSGRDEAHGVALDPNGNAYAAGETDGTFPEAGTDPPGNDAFVAKLAIGTGPAPIPPVPTIPPVPEPAPATPETTITARPPAQTPDQVVQFRFAGKMPGQINPSAGISFGCRLDGGAFAPCTSPVTTKKLALAQHTFEVRAVNGSGVVDPTPATFTFRVTQPKPEVKHYACDLKIVGAYHDRGTRDWGPCDVEIPCPREAVCLLDLAVDEHDDSYLFNYDVHLQHFEDGAYKDRVFCFAPSLKTPVNPKLEVRFDPRRGEFNRHHACHEEGAYGLVDTSKDNRIRYRCSGSGHSPKPGGDRTTGEGFEDNAHLRCDITATIQRQAMEFGAAVVDGASPNLLVYAPAPGSVTVSGIFGTGARASAKPAITAARATTNAAGAVRVPLRLNAAAKKARRKRALSAKLTITFVGADGLTLTSSRTVKLKRAAAKRRARTRA